jgi:hypothetical protein
VATALGISFFLGTLRMRRIRATAIIGAIIVVATMKWLYEARTLSHYRQQIERTYAPAIALIEQKSLEWPNDWSDEVPTKKEGITAEIRDSLSMPEVAHASWSFDGHHGARSLSAWNCSGLSINPIYRTADLNSHVARYGKTFEGKPLVILEGFVPDGVMKRYQIAVFSESLNGR